MKGFFNKAGVRPIWAAALLLSAATITGAYRAPVGAWRAQQEQTQQQKWEDRAVLGSHSKYEGENNPNMLGLISALQVASASEKQTEEDEPAEGSATEGADSQGEKGSNTEAEGSSTTAEGTEEHKPEESAHHEEGGSKAEEPSAKESRAAAAAASHAAGEADTAKSSTSEEEKEGGPHTGTAASGRESAAESVAAPGAATAAATVAQPVHEHKAEAAPAAETAAEAAHPGKALEAAKPEHKEEGGTVAGGTPAVAAAAPSTEKFVMQMNFRPSLVIGRAEADRTERHVVRDADGTSWFEVLGPKTLTVLNLKPVQGEELLHSVVATTVHT